MDFFQPAGTQSMDISFFFDLGLSAMLRSVGPNWDQRRDLLRIRVNQFLGLIQIPGGPPEDPFALIRRTSTFFAKARFLARCQEIPAVINFLEPRVVAPRPPPTDNVAAVCQKRTHPFRPGRISKTPAVPVDVGPGTNGQRPVRRIHGGNSGRQHVAIRGSVGPGPYPINHLPAGASPKATAAKRPSGKTAHKLVFASIENIRGKPLSSFAFISFVYLLLIPAFYRIRHR